MYAEDRVLVGVIGRRKDLRLARDAGWYRIPAERPLRGLERVLDAAVDVEYLAFFTPRHRDQAGGVYWYAERRGVELAYRRDLLPDEPNHPRADQVYYRVSLSPFVEKAPPVLNPSGRRFAFIRTTWDRFEEATTIAELYSKSRFFVSRVYYALGRPSS